MAIGWPDRQFCRGSSLLGTAWIPAHPAPVAIVPETIGTFGTAGPAVKIIPLLFIIAAACSPYQRSVQYLDLANRVAAIPPFIQYAWLLAVASSDSTASAAR